MNFEKYVGIPYAEKGRDITGLDCYGLVRLIYKNEYKIDLPSFTSEYDADDNNRIQELLAQYKEGWESVDSPSVGDIVLFRIMGIESHVGLVISPTHFIHVRENQDSAIESLSAHKWSKRIVGFFKYSEKNVAILNTAPHPLKTERYTLAIVPGTSVTDLVKDISLQYNVAPELKSRISIIINGRVIAQEKWSNTIINTGDVIEYRAVPTGGVVRAIAFLAVAYFAPIIAGELIASTVGITGAAALGSTGIAVLNGIATVGVMLVGSALINAIAPIRPPVMGERNDPGSAERQLMVNGGSNRGSPYGSIPVVLGKVRMTPLLGSNNFLTYENERDSYLSMLLVWGYGPLNIDDTSYKIGDVPLSSFTNVTKVTLDRKTEPSDTVKRNFDAIYGKDITQVNTAVELVCEGNPETAVTPGPWFEAATVEPVSSVTIALHFPQGLRRIDVKGDTAGNSYPVAVTFRVEYSNNNGATWNLLEVFTIGGDTAKKDGFTNTKTYHVSENQLIIRVRRETGDNTEDNSNRRYYFTSNLQNVTFLRNAHPAVDPVGSKIAKTAFKIKATDQLNGSIQGVSAVVQTWCKTWNGSAWVDGATSNPAALMRYVLEHPANPRRVTNAASQINLTQLQYFHDYCTARGFEYNSTLGQTRSVLEVIRDICAAGRASPALVDGKWTVVIDEIKPNVIQHFTPHNSWGFEGVKALPKRPDGLRINYFDQDYDYQESEIIVYDIGKNENNASLFESITLPGVTKRSLVIDHAKWHMAQMKLRPELYTLNTDIEYLVCNRGDRVKVMHDVPMWGLGSGRIKNRLASNVFELDEDVPYQAGVTYVVRIRGEDGSSNLRTIVESSNVTKFSRTNGITKITFDNTGHPFNAGDSLNLKITGAINIDSTVIPESFDDNNIYYSENGPDIIETTVSGYVSWKDGYYSKIKVNSALTVTEANNSCLFLYGQNKNESQDLIVLSIEPSNNNNARITLVDYGVTDSYNIFTQYQSLSETTVFESQITLPPLLQIDNYKNKIPTITGFVSDESVMERVSKSVFKYAINVTYFNAPQLPTTTESVEVQYDLSESTSDVNLRSIFVPYQKGSVTIPDVNQGETYKIRMRYISNTGRLSEWSSYSNHTVVGKTNPPSQVTEFAVTSDKSSGQLLLSWRDNPEPDTFTYEVRTEDFGWGNNDVHLIFYGDANKVITKYVSNGSVTFYIRAIDSSGNYSQLTSVVSYVPQPIPNITDIAYSYSDTALTSATVSLSWQEVTTSEFNIAYYEVNYNGTSISVKANTVNLPADWVGDRIFTIKAVDIHGNKSSGYSELISKLAPNSPTDLRTQVVDNTVMLYWTLPDRTSLPIDHVLLKKGEFWETAINIGEKKGEFTTITEVQGGQYTYWLSCIDTEGIGSPPVSVTTVVSEPPDFIFNGEFNSTFTGTKSNAEFDGTTLVLPINNTETWQDHFTSRSWSTPQDQISAGYPIYCQPSAASGYYEEVFDFGQPLISSRITLSYKGNVVIGSPVISYIISLSLDNITYVDYSGVTELFGTNFRYVKVRIIVSDPTSVGLYAVENITVRLDAKLKNDAGSISASASDTLGSIVNFNKEFIDVTSITLSASGTTPISCVYDMKDNFVSGTYSVSSNVCTVNITNHGLITGQDVKLFISSGTGISAIYTITGYTTNSFTVNMTTANTSGDISMYPQSFRAYLFNNSGTRVSSSVSWSIKGY
jgi:sulfur carrier protein ThiS